MDRDRPTRTSSTQCDRLVRDADATAGGARSTGRWETRACSLQQRLAGHRRRSLDADEFERCRRDVLEHAALADGVAVASSGGYEVDDRDRISGVCGVGLCDGFSCSQCCRNQL